MNTSPPSSPSQLTPAGGLSTPPAHLARTEFPTPPALEDLGLPVQLTSVHPVLAPLSLATASPSQAVDGPARLTKHMDTACHSTVARSKDPAESRSMPSSSELEEAPLQIPPSHPAGSAETRAVTPSINGSPTAVRHLGMALTPTSPPSTVSSFGIIAPASPTPTPMSLWRSGHHPVDDSTSTDEDSTMQRQASHNLDNSKDAAPSVFIDIQDDLHSSRRAVIPKVRANLRRVAADLFTPYTIPIGPYQQDADSWQWTGEVKKRAVLDLGSRADLSGLELVMDRVQRTARGYYTHLPEPDNHATDSRKLSDMLLRDGCYLVNLFVDCQPVETTGSTSSDGSQTMVPSDNAAVRDVLYLLENQIPLFVIDKILNYLRAQGEEKSAVECIARPIENLLQRQLYISKTPRVVPSASFHLLDLVYSYMASRHQQQRQQEEEERPRRLLTGRWRRATEYRRYANLQFKRRAFGAGDEWTILDVDIEGGNLLIPLLRVDSNTWTVLRNLMALEEQEEARPVTAYCYFMSQVACTAEDVGLLRSAMVVEHFLGTDKSAALGFACLCDGMALDIDNLQRNYLKPIWHDVEKRCGVQAHNFKGFFREKYCGNIFYRVVFFFAIVVFVSQMVQSIYAVIAYHKPKN